MASITLSNQHHVIQALFTRRAVGVLFTPLALALSLALIFSLTVIVYGATLPSGLFIPCMTMGALLGRCVRCAACGRTRCCCKRTRAARGGSVLDAAWRVRRAAPG